jgi:hypothetical protein
MVCVYIEKFEGFELKMKKNIRANKVGTKYYNI